MPSWANFLPTIAAAEAASLSENETAVVQAVEQFKAGYLREAKEKVDFLSALSQHVC